MFRVVELGFISFDIFLLSNRTSLANFMPLIELVIEENEESQKHIVYIDKPPGGRFQYISSSEEVPLTTRISLNAKLDYYFSSHPSHPFHPKHVWERINERIRATAEKIAWGLNNVYKRSNVHDWREDDDE